MHQDDLETSLRDAGHAPLPQLLTPDLCREIASWYDAPGLFRSRIDMQRFRFGSGEYQYFAYPLPAPIAALRDQLYATLAPIATRWMSDLGKPVEFPPALDQFLATCHQAGQVRPTPLLLRYRAGDFNCLHQDLYGDLVFPFQVVVMLSRSGVDYDGGELLLVEQQPRAQSIGRVLKLNQGDAAVITTRHRPVQGKRGFYRTNIRHGVSPITRGERHTLGIVFHDAL